MKSMLLSCGLLTHYQLHDKQGWQYNVPWAPTLWLRLDNIGKQWFISPGKSDVNKHPVHSCPSWAVVPSWSWFCIQIKCHIELQWRIKILLFRNCPGQDCWCIYKILFCLYSLTKESRPSWEKQVANPDGELGSRPCLFLYNGFFFFFLESISYAPQGTEPHIALHEHIHVFWLHLNKQESLTLLHSLP